MTDREAHYQCILESPEDDTPRLTYADRLEEEGEPERAEFIRVQVELAGLSCNEKGMWSTCSAAVPCSSCEQIAVLRSRERALFAAHGAEWFGGNSVLLNDSGAISIAWMIRNDPLLVPARGFPAHWYGPWSEWVGGECPNCDGIGRVGNDLCNKCGKTLRGTSNWCCGVNHNCRDCADEKQMYRQSSGRIPGACDTLACRKGWEMECGTCKGDKSVFLDGIGEDEACPVCHGSGRVDRPVPSGAVPLETVTLTTMPNRFVEDGNFGLERCAVRIPAVRVPDDGAVEKELCEAEWPGLVFNLPSVNRG